MSDNFDPIDLLVNELKGNTSFLNKLLFPRISLAIGIVVFLIVIVLILR